MNLIAAPVEKPAVSGVGSSGANQPRRQLPALTGIRFFAAAFILIAHAADWILQFTDSDIKRYLSFLAMYGMPLFFVLSGFVIHYNYYTLFHSGYVEAVTKFAAARFARLYPLFLFFLAFSFAADDTYLHGHFDQTIGYYLTLTQSWFYRQVGGHLLLYYTFPLSWSISTEMFFYLTYVLIVPFIVAASGPRRALIASAAFMALGTVGFSLIGRNLDLFLKGAEAIFPDFVTTKENFQDSFFRWLFYFSPYVRVAEFLTGCLVAQLFLELQDRPVTRSEWWCGQLASWLAAAGLAAFGYFSRVGWPPSLAGMGGLLSQNFGCAPEIAVLIFCAARYDTVFSRWTGSMWLVALGETSYSIYLVHTWTLKLFVRAPIQIGPLTLFGAILRFTFGIIFTLIVASATYRLIEVPARRWIRNWSAKAIDTAFLGQTHGPSMRTGAPLVAGWRTAAVGITLLFIGCAIVQFGPAAIANMRAGMRVIEATYGANCAASASPQNTVKKGNATASVAEICNFATECTFTVDVMRLGDPANGCGKDFTVTYKCSRSGDALTVGLPGEADGNSVRLKCR